MAIQAYISVKGSRQAQFKGETLKAGRQDKWMSVLSVVMDLQVPRDPATGQATGRRQYLPVKIIKAWGAASPQGLSACATNENLPEVRIEFVKATTTGVEEVYQSISLTDASFSRGPALHLRRHCAARKHSGGRRMVVHLPQDRGRGQ
jgi:type VI secretion system secreted protein Hcp